MMKKILLAAAVAGSMGAVTAPVLSQEIYVRVAPPAPRVEHMPEARRGYNWVPGYWDWRGNRYQWVAGTWVRERPGYVYHSPQWRERNGRWYMERGRWGRGDRDGDGVPNRFDNRPNDPRRN